MVVHLSLGSLVYPLIMGIVFCLIVQKTGSVLYSIIVHFCNNFLVLLIEYLSNISGKSIMPNITLWWQYVLALVMAVVAIAVIYLLIKKALNPSTLIINGPKILNSKTDNESGNIEDISIQNITKKQDIFSVIYTLIIGFAFWLIVVILSLI